MQRRRVLPMAAIACLAACGGEAEPERPAGRVRRLALTSDIGPEERSELELLARFHRFEEIGNWRFRGADAPQTERGPLRLLVRPTGETGIDIPGPFDPAELGQVFMQLSTDKNTRVEARLWHAEQLLARSGRRTVRRRSSGGVVLEFPLLKRRTRPVTRISIEFKESDAAVTLTEVALFSVPARRYVPALGGGCTLAAVGHESRRAACLSSEHPLRSSFEVAGYADLAFSYAMPEEVRVAGQRPVVEVELRSESGGLVRESFALEQELKTPARWHRATIPLAGWAGERVTATFELETELERESLCLLGEPVLRSPDDAAPSVLLITSDTHRADHVGIAAGGVDVRTPFLDRLAAEGVYFEDVFASTNVTNPSHAALFTGLSPRDLGVINNETLLSDAAPTLAERFSEAGYVTFAAVSARHLDDRWSGLGQGFDRLGAPPRSHRDAAATIAELSSWLVDAEGAALFVWLHLYDAHGPYAPPEEYARLYYPEDRDPFDREAPGAQPRLAPRWNWSIADPSYTEALYRSEVTFLDQRLERLASGSRFADGLVVFTADHGESMRHGPKPFSHVGLRPSTLSVPLILKVPGAAGGLRVTRPVRQLDVGRTLLDLAGLQDAAFPGTHLLTEPGTEPREVPRFALESNRRGASVQVGRWMLVIVLSTPEGRPDLGPESYHAVRLYDVEQDPHLEVDLLESEPGRALRLRTLLVNWLTDAPAESWAAGKRVRNQILEEHLAALGYATGDDGAAATVWIDPECGCRWCARWR